MRVLSFGFGFGWSDSRSFYDDLSPYLFSVFNARTQAIGLITTMPSPFSSFLPSFLPSFYPFFLATVACHLSSGVSS